MAEIKIKRVYEESLEADGLRVLVDRLWPRGVLREAAHLDAWNKEVAPSPELRRWFNHDPERFCAFAARYRDELASSEAAEIFVRQCAEAIAENRQVTLVFAARDYACNHALVLRDWVLAHL
ncbi:MAG: DUF488 family protein [Berryella intestinalis]|uniref:DUF488 domain-containing protein n=1 Tax=Berryella intestinalis TaxID=1531429 RepID=UPI002A513ED8|nr:DUF488 family protein [Berryella intestinalis]MDD7368548.1 DUF488 family protein [Berryella intestinalis]MDY3129113.1 DUF488 family protein [Berryella intestinalis]